MSAPDAPDAPAAPVVPAAPAVPAAPDDDYNDYKKYLETEDVATRRIGLLIFLLRCTPSAAVKVNPLPEESELIRVYAQLQQDIRNLPKYGTSLEKDFETWAKLGTYPWKPAFTLNTGHEKNCAKRLFRVCLLAKELEWETESWSKGRIKQEVGWFLAGKVYGGGLFRIRSQSSGYSPENPGAFSTTREKKMDIRMRERS